MVANKKEEKSGIHIYHVNESGIKKSSSKVDRKGSSKFDWKIVLITIAAVAALGVGVGGMLHPILDAALLKTPEIPYSVADTLATNSDETSLDEILEQQKTEDGQLSLLEKVKQLEMYLDMSGKLDDLHLISYTDKVIEIEETDTFDEDLATKYQEFLTLSKNTKEDVLSEDALRLNELAAELNGYKGVVDSKITADGYDILAEYSILVAKTAVLDASGISYTNIGNLSIPKSNMTSAVQGGNFVINYTAPTTGEVFDIHIPSSSFFRGQSIIHDVIENAFSSQTKDKTNLTVEEIIKDLKKYLNDAKVATFARYTNDGSLVTTRSYQEIRDIIEAPKTK